MRELIQRARLYLLLVGWPWPPNETGRGRAGSDAAHGRDVMRALVLKHRVPATSPHVGARGGSIYRRLRLAAVLLGFADNPAGR